MKKELKDYLHLYLGCEVVGTYDDASGSRGYLTGITNGGAECEIQFILEDGFNVEEEPYFNETKEVKPILRPLSDMSEDEWQDIENHSSVMPDAHGYNGIKDNFLIDTPSVRFSWKIVNETLIELRKRGIDVDGLIESGLAIDKTTLKTKRHIGFDEFDENISQQP